MKTRWQEKIQGYGMKGLITSIRFRLALWFAIILAAVLAAFSIFVYTRQLYDLRQDTLSRLEQKTRQWETYLKYSGKDYFSGSLLLVPSTNRSGEPFLEEPDILALIGLENQVVHKVGPISYESIEELVLFAMQKGASQGSFSFPIVEATTSDRLIRENYLFVVAPISFERSLIGFFVLGSPIDPNGQLPSLLFTLVLGNVLTFGLALGGGVWLANRAMQPVQMITRTAHEISETDLSRRLNLETHDELGDLARTFDQMLARLQTAFERQRQFTADASHELRTPLTIVSLEANRALASNRSQPEYRSALEVIRSENDRMTCLVNNLLTLSRMDAGQARLNLSDLDLSDVALEVIERLEPLAERRGVALSTGELPEVTVLGDRQYLSQMISNLVENAIKYSLPKGGHVQVDTGFQTDEQNQPLVGWVRVEDDGPGIPSENLPHIFDRFYQVDKARSHHADEVDGESGEPLSSPGSGLGLSIAQWIARAHGGDVTVQSQVGHGSIFTFRVPLRQQMTL